MGLIFLCVKKEPREVSAQYQCGKKNFLEVKRIFEGTTRSCQLLAETKNTDCLNTNASNTIFHRRYHDGTKLKDETFFKKYLF